MNISIKSETTKRNKANVDILLLQFPRITGWVSGNNLHSESQVGFPVCLVMGFLYSLHSEPQVGFPVCLVMGILYSLHSESQVGFPVWLVMGFLYSSPFRVTGWVSCVLSDGFPLLFSIQSHIYNRILKYVFEKKTVAQKVDLTKCILNLAQEPLIDEVKNIKLNLDKGKYYCHLCNFGRD